MKKFLSTDLHIGIKDLQSIFSSLGHQLDVWSISDHHHLMEWPRAKVDIYNQYTWRNINKQMCDDFYSRYKDELKDYDGFVCFYPPAASMLFEKFNKPIIIQVPIRYEVPFDNNPSAWKSFNDYLIKGIDKKQIILLANSLYDSKYTELFVGKKCPIIPSLCDYTGAKYTGKQDKFLFCAKDENLRNFIRHPNIIAKKQIKNHSWQDIADFKAIIHIPYTSSQMSIFENYTSNIPMLFPSKELLVNLWEQYSNIVMSELSWRQIGWLPPSNRTDLQSPDPNNYKSKESFIYWSALSDFYEEEKMPHIQYFDSFHDLEDKLYTLNFDEISEKMRFHNISRREQILNSWNNILGTI